jgi:D-glycero-D-manno-heptose 1,7-bisphosphate phosphatase
MLPVQQAVVLVGGRGTRLGVVTERTPKPMLPVDGKPFLEYLLLFLRRFEVRRILFCSGYRAEQIEDHFGCGERFGFEIQYSVEKTPAGTGGALLLAGGFLDSTFFVLNGDTLFETNLRKLSLLLLSGSAERLASIALRWVSDVSRYGRTLLEGNDIVAFAEKGAAGAGLINGGVYCLKRAVLELLPKAPCSIERDLFPRLAAMGSIAGLPSESFFLDIGLPETLRQAQKELPQRFQGVS